MTLTATGNGVSWRSSRESNAEMYVDTLAKHLSVGDPQSFTTDLADNEKRAFKVRALQDNVVMICATRTRVFLIARYMLTP